MAFNKLLDLIVLTIAALLMASNAVLSVSNTTDINTIDFNDIIINLQYKLDKFSAKLNQVDGALQSLQEKSHTWVIFRHHIDAWNGQMQALEQKLEAIQRSQEKKDDNVVQRHSFELILKQILSKIVLMTDTCQANNENILQRQESNKQEIELISEREALIQDYEKATGAFKRAQFEAITRINNILRFVHNVDYKRICEAKKKKLNKQQDFTKNGISQENYKNFETVGVNKDTKKCENNKLITMTNVTRYIKQLHEQTHKNTKNFHSLTKTLGTIEEKLSIWHDNAENNINYMTKQCQSASKELSTFSESSDLLLKRIEFLVHNVDQKLNSINWNINEHTNIYKHKNDTTDFEKEQDQDEHEGIEYDMMVTEIPTEHEEIFSTSKEDVFDDSNNDILKNQDVDFIQPQISGCHELNENQRIDGIYKFQTPITNKAGRDFNERLCVWTVIPGENLTAWTVIQNRGPYVEQENFNRSWSEYSSGFGDLSKDFWFGNEFTHILTYQNDYELRIEMENFDNEVLWAEYKIFRIESEAFNYNLLIDEYQGNVGDAMKYHNNMDFSAYDRRNDLSVDACCSCAVSYGSGWWFNNCADANLNGVYQETPNGHNYVGIIWEQWQKDYSLYKVRMMIRPKAEAEVFNNTDNGDP